MSKYELIHKDTPFGMKFFKKIIDKRTGEVVIFGSIVDVPYDEPLCEIIEEFGIPVIRLKGKNYKIRYVALTAIRKSLKIKDHQKFVYPQKIIVWIHPRETITKQEYNAQVGMQTQFAFVLGGKPLTLVSLGDAIQILSVLQTEREKVKLIRKLIIKMEELQKKINKQQKRIINYFKNQLEQLDDICYDWIKEHQEDNIYIKGYKRLTNHELWQMIINIHYEIRQLLGLPVPKKENAGLHHSDRPYRNIYPHVATKGQIIDKRWDHEDPRQKRFI